MYFFLLLLLLAYPLGECSEESDNRTYDACDSHKQTNLNDQVYYYHRDYWPSWDYYYNTLEGENPKPNILSRNRVVPAFSIAEATRFTQLIYKNGEKGMTRTYKALLWLRQRFAKYQTPKAADSAIIHKYNNQREIFKLFRFMVFIEHFISSNPLIHFSGQVGDSLIKNLTLTEAVRVTIC